MISWIIATHDMAMYERNFLSSIEGQFLAGDEILTIKYANSITEAYRDGQRQAQFQTKIYIHHDVQVLDLGLLRTFVLEATENPKTGMVGVIGSRTMLVPWWNGSPLGSVMDSRLGRISFAGAGECAVLDGLMLATAQHVDWDTTWPGWHGYDYDSCMQMTKRGLVNWCVPAGDRLLFHNSDSPLDLQQIEGWQSAAAIMTQKWGYGRDNDAAKEPAA